MSRVHLYVPYMEKSVVKRARAHINCMLNAVDARASVHLHIKLLAAVCRGVRCVFVHVDVMEFMVGSLEVRVRIVNTIYMYVYIDAMCAVGWNLPNLASRIVSVQSRKSARCLINCIIAANAMVYYNQWYIMIMLRQWCDKFSYILQVHRMTPNANKYLEVANV